MKHTLLLFFFSFLLLPSAETSVLPYNGGDEPKPVAEGVRVYPNPAIDYIELTGDVSGVKTILIYNMVGRVMRKYSVYPDERYEVSMLPNGMYLVQLLDTNKKVVSTQRINKR